MIDTGRRTLHTYIAEGKGLEIQDLHTRYDLEVSLALTRSSVTPVC